jgi:predicted  nucleic acid-binding Zn-ribbon protein
VKAAPEHQAALLELGRIDTDLVRIAKTLRTLPAKQVATDAESDLQAARENLRLAQEDVDGFHADVTRAESDVELVDKRIAQDKERLQATTSAKDAQGLEHELDTLMSRKSLLEDVELEVMEKLEEATVSLQEAQARVADIQARLDGALADIASQSAEFDHTKKSLLAERDTLVDGLPKDLVELYERQRERYGVGVSELRGGISTASGVQLTELDLQHIRQAADDDVVLCPDSNAILVRAR